MTDTEWDFDSREELTIESAVFQALGGASACWGNLQGAGEFDSTKCKAIGEKLVEFSKNHFQGNFALQATPEALSAAVKKMHEGQIAGTVALPPPTAVQGSPTIPEDTEPLGPPDELY